ncbi:N-acetylmuramoyl-L-alanine amidase [Shouchella shacheensis]|uniref:N-acetylmuramoyl-L-alanine amidase n=1 Tax=Shouchella shacheensis TaxID=1649580 RepID=UPI0007405061|nr:N-acetylmuramoyl-L-alanine amidase [Shouchella shacheensis]
MKLYLDPGHGGRDPGATGNGLQEKNIALDIALRIRTILANDYNNVEVTMSRTTDRFVSLSARTNEANAWGADYFLSIHCNAFNGSARGYEDFIHSSLSDTSQTARYQATIHSEVLKQNNLPDRGRKKANFHVLRETVMSALLTENGFIDNNTDAALMREASWRQAVAQGHVNGLEAAFGLERKESSGTLYRVIAGSFKEKGNAEKRVENLQSNGIDAFVSSTQISGELWYRVQAGAFRNRQNAQQRVSEIKEAGIEDVFIIEQNIAATAVSDYMILGPSRLSPEQMDRYARSIHPDAPLLGSYYLRFGEYYGIRGDVAFAQALHETDYFRFTGVVQPDQNNYAGIGATGPDNPGASFYTPRDGVLAHLQHLFAYASSEPLPEKYPLVDPRFDLVQRGSAPTWVALNGKWAVPGDRYGQLILALYERMVEASINELGALLQELQ